MFIVIISFLTIFDRRERNDHYEHELPPPFTAGAWRLPSLTATFRSPNRFLAYSGDNGRAIVPVLCLFRACRQPQGRLPIASTLPAQSGSPTVLRHELPPPAPAQSRSRADR